MRILEVTDRSGYGGIERVADDLTAGLEDRGHYVIRASVLDSGRGSCVSLGVREIGGWGASVQCHRALRRLCDAFDLELVHSHCGLANRALWMIRGRGIARVATTHSFDATYKHYSSLREWRVRIEARVALARSHVVFVANHVARDYETRWGRCGVSSMVIHNGVAAREEPAGEGHSIDVLQVGNFFPVKNHAEALEAIRLLRIGGLPLRVVFLGGGTGRPRVQRIAEASGVSDQVGFAGEQDARAFFRYARVVIAPSVYEGCPLNVLEAMGSGCAVVASDIPGHREIAERWPQLELYPLGRPDILARKIKEALRHRQSGRVYSAIPPEYTWRSTLDAYERLFARALGRTNEPLET